jgi:hypothetical protein
MEVECGSLALLHSGWKAAGVLAGGGSGAVAALLGQPGASRFVIEVQVPYQKEALVDYVGKPLASCSSSITTAYMAQIAYERARKYAPHSSHILGWACSAALATQPARQGNDRAYLAVYTSSQRFHRYLPCRGERAVQEEQVVREIFTLLNEVVGANA